MEPEEQFWKGRISTLSAHLVSGQDARSVPTDKAFRVSAEVRQALAEGGPVIALESTIISHGMPFPRNLETALAVEQIIREEGAVPATIAIFGGVPHIGLCPVLLKRLAARYSQPEVCKIYTKNRRILPFYCTILRRPLHVMAFKSCSVYGRAVQKTSRRDLPYVLARKLDGATTVSATMLLAARAGIPIFATGGIGGVHRGGQDSLDISSDLTEFTKSPIAVVSAGVKSILDIRRTLEYLETQGVPVVGYGASEFPAFFTRESGCKAPCRVEDAEDAADLIRSMQKLDLKSGILFGVPIPEAHAAEGARIEDAIRRSVEEADLKELAGAELTPFLLERIQKLTNGASLKANIALIKNNAQIGARIAVALAKKPLHNT